MASSNNLLRLQILSQLGLPENIFIAAFLAECHQYFPSLSNSFCFLNKKLAPTDIYDELNHQSFLSSLASLFKKKPQLDISSLLKQQHIVTSHKDWHHHPLNKAYRETFARTGYHQSLILPVFDSDKVLGLLIFNRDRKDKPFNAVTIKKAQSIRDELEAGLEQCNKHSIKTTTGWRSGLIIVDQRGEMAQCCPEGQNLLSLALQRKPGILQRTSFADIRNIPGVLEMIDKLLDTTTPVTNAEITVSSLWGDFLINGFPVVDKGGHRAPQVYLNITWQVPFSLMLFRNIQYMCFTPRQQHIAMLYASGESTKSIANKLGLSLYTIKEHVQHIFEKLQIHTRAELIEHIMCRDCKPSSEELEQGPLHGTERAAMNLSRA